MKALFLSFLWIQLISYSLGQGANELGLNLGFALTEQECKLLINPPMTTMSERSKHYNAVASQGPELLSKVLERLETGSYSDKTGRQLSALLVPLSEGVHATSEIRARMSKVVKNLILSTDNKDTKVFLSAFFVSRGRQEDVPFIREVLLKPTDTSHDLFLMRGHALNALSKLGALQQGEDIRPFAFKSGGYLPSPKNVDDVEAKSESPPLRSPETPISQRENSVQNSWTSSVNNYTLFAVGTVILAALVMILAKMRGGK